jgi:hypothetical protein
LEADEFFHEFVSLAFAVGEGFVIGVVAAGIIAVSGMEDCDGDALHLGFEAGAKLICIGWPGGTVHKDSEEGAGRTGAGTDPGWGRSTVK